jgi:hypothetical protein
MPLDAAKIQELLAKKNAPRRTGGGGGRKKQHDPNDRSYKAWFALSQEIINKETNEPMRCENPSCVDPRPPVHGGQFVVEVNGKLMCRYCFVEGWLLANPAQESIENVG